MGHQQRGSIKVKLYPGDTIVFYTDGITEAQSLSNDLFGLSRLIYIIESRASASPEALQQHIQAEVIDFWRHASSRDDATLLVVKILPHSDMISLNISTRQIWNILARFRSRLQPPAGSYLPSAPVLGVTILSI
jgi:hypothetical protein